MHFQFACRVCGATQNDRAPVLCFRCGESLGFEYENSYAIDLRFAPSIARFWRRLPVEDASDFVSLGEGNTPLVRSCAFDDLEVYWKDETRNPTGSHKDRSMALALTQARRIGASRSVVVSAGSTGLSNAAYSARAGIASTTVMETGTPPDRLYPLSVYGSRVIEVDASIDQIIQVVDRLSQTAGVFVSSTTRRSNPVQAEAAKTISYEIVEELGEAPDYVVVPVGGGGTLSALWRGFKELVSAGVATRLPRIAAVVPQTHNALQVAFLKGITEQAAFDALSTTGDQLTILTKLAHAHPPDGVEALGAIRESGGTVVAVDDAAAIEGTLALARSDGLYFEPVSGLLLPAIKRLRENRFLARGSRVVGLACGSGYRESFAISAKHPLKIETVQFSALEEVLSTPQATRQAPPHIAQR